jgi:hypothetical protein
MISVEVRPAMDIDPRRAASHEGMRNHPIFSQDTVKPGARPALFAGAS